MASTIAIRVQTDAARAQRDLDRMSGSMDRLQGAARKAAVPAAAIVGGLALVGKKALDAASELEQAQGAVESVFGRSADAVKKYADTSAERLGVARSEYLNSASLMGSALQNAGFKASRAASMTDKAFTRSADLAATFGGTAAEAMDAINAAVSRGEFDPLEKYAVSLNATAINAELAKRGQDKLSGAALKNAKAQVVLDEIYKQTGKTAGQFAREADTAAGSQQRAAAAAKNAMADLGAVLLPIAAKVATALASMARWMSQNATTVQILAAILGSLAGAILILNGALTAYNAVVRIIPALTKAWAIAQKVLNAAMKANPIGIAVTALVLLGGALVLAYKKSETFRNIVNAAFRGVMSVVRPVIDFFRKTIPPVFAFVVRVVGTYVRTYVKVVTTAFTVAWKVVARVVGVIRKVVTTVWRGIVAAVRGAVNAYRTVVTSAFNAVRNVVGRVLGAIRNTVGRLWGGVVDIVRNGGTRIVDGVRAIPGKIANLAGSFGRAGRAIINAFVNGLKNAAGVISGIAGNVWQALRGMLNSAISKINNALEFTIDPPGPGKVSVNPPNIPMLATGGIVSHPTLAMVGEAGPEAVIPLDRLGSGGPVVVEVYLDGTLIDRKIERGMGRQARNIVMRGVGG